MVIIFFFTVLKEVLFLNHIQLTQKPYQP